MQMYVYVYNQLICSISQSVDIFIYVGNTFRHAYKYIHTFMYCIYIYFIQHSENECAN